MVQNNKGNGLKSSVFTAIGGSIVNGDPSDESPQLGLEEGETGETSLYSLENMLVEREKEARENFKAKIKEETSTQKIKQRIT